MLTFISLIIVHFVADFYLQRDAWIQSKILYKVKSFGLFKHVLVHLVLNAAVLFLLLGEINQQYWTALFAMVLTHYAIDIWKCYQQFSIKAFLIDQISHVCVLIVVSLYLQHMLSLEQMTEFVYGLTERELAVVATVVILGKPASFVIHLTLSAFITASQSTSGVKHAGPWIGFLERLLVFVFAMLDQFLVVGLLLVAKSVFTIGTAQAQRDTQATDSKILGTFLSVSIAILAGILVSFT